MSKKSRFHWQKNAPKPLSAQTEPEASATLIAQSQQPILSPVSPAQLAANRANSQLSTGPRTAAGKANSSQNALKSALTGRTVLLPTDDVEEYAAFATGFECDLKPVGQFECELVQIIADCHWRLRRIQTLEYALYAHGHEQFADGFQNSPEEQRYSKILLQTHLTYEKQFRNLQIQEARLDRKSSKAMAELRRLQAERTIAASEPDIDAFPNEEALFAALDAGFVPASVAARLARPPSDGSATLDKPSRSALPGCQTQRASKEVHKNGFDFSNDSLTPDSAAPSVLEHEAA